MTGSLSRVFKTPNSILPLLAPVTEKEDEPKQTQGVILSTVNLDLPGGREQTAMRWEQVCF